MNIPRSTKAGTIKITAIKKTTKPRPIHRTFFIAELIGQADGVGRDSGGAVSVSLDKAMSKPDYTPMEIVSITDRDFRWNDSSDGRKDLLP